jgi:hypothetical protein
MLSHSYGMAVVLAGLAGWSLLSDLDAEHVLARRTESLAHGVHDPHKGHTRPHKGLDLRVDIDLFLAALEKLLSHQPRGTTERHDDRSRIDVVPWRVHLALRGTPHVDHKGG